MTDTSRRRPPSMARRVIRRLLPGRAGAEQEQLHGEVSTLAAMASVHGAQIDDLRQTLRGLNHGETKLARHRDVLNVERRLELLAAMSRREHRIVARALKQADWLEELRVDERRVLKRIERLRRSDRPVVVGPWSGEVGFEVLYWIPFVTWVLEQAKVAPARVIVISRGGPASWYGHLGGRYLDTLSFVTPDVFRRETEEVKKQRGVGRFDRAIVRRVMAAHGVRQPLLLHPGLMYDLFYPVWKQKATVRRVEAFTMHQRLSPPLVPELQGRLPAEYVAVRFYFSQAFPDTPENRAFIDATLRTLSMTTDIVLLNTSFHVDDHRDYVPGGSGRVYRIDDLMTPERNLEIQAAVIAGARAFVGTYGGYSYLAPLYGVASLAFYSVRESFFAHHLELAERIFRRLHAGSFVVLDVNHVDLLRGVLAVPAGQPS